MITTLTTKWFEDEQGPKLFTTSSNRIQIHEFAKNQQKGFLEHININLKDKEGVYILLGQESNKRDVYIGEAENLASRLYDHSKDDQKAFTERIALITSKDSQSEISKNELHFIEKELIRKFTLSNYEVKNRNKGQGNMTNTIKLLEMRQEMQFIHSGLESLGISLEDNVKSSISKSDFLDKGVESIEIYTNIPNTKVIIYATLNTNKTVTIHKGQVIKHKSRNNKWANEVVTKELDSASMNQSLRVKGDASGYEVEFVEDVTYNTWSSSVYLIKGGIEASSSTWKNKKTNKGI